MSLTKSIRIILKHVRRFIAGFASVPTFAFGKSDKFPFNFDRFALNQDQYELNMDAEMTKIKQKQNERK